MINVPGQHRFGVEALHDKDGFTLLFDKCHIKVRCKGAVDREFPLQYGAALFNRGKIKIREFYILLDLEGTVTTKKYMGCMSFYVLYRRLGKAPHIAV
jgi:anaerobic ribonucleoside-triphosphate reductase